MATATTAAAVDGILQRLESGVVRRGLPSKFDEVLDYLKSPLCMLGSVLSILMEDQSLEDLVRMRKIKRVLYALEDLLDDLEYHGSIRHRPSRRTCTLQAAPFSLTITVSHTHLHITHTIGIGKQ
jgi:hypothetical protein